jgi:hypothetical protein
MLDLERQLHWVDAQGLAGGEGLTDSISDSPVDRIADGIVVA